MDVAGSCFLQARLLARLRKTKGHVKPVLTGWLTRGLMHLDTTKKSDYHA